ncbi:MAG: hypothetical protein FWH17_04800 [Oscillospiraceae bacterium]|nr:hypothetical protein [Oscillospiraceae bacterium]
MKSCARYIKIISSCADGELGGQKAQKAAAHINACEKCSALLQIYKELAALASASAPDAPSSLCGNVMDTVRKEAAHGAHIGQNDAQKKALAPLFIKYVPIAACLAAGLVVWGLWDNLFGTRMGDDIIPAANDSSIMHSLASIEEYDIAGGAADSAGNIQPGSGAESSGSGDRGIDDESNSLNINPDELNGLGESEWIYGISVVTDREYYPEGTREIPISIYNSNSFAVSYSGFRLDRFDDDSGAWVAVDNDEGFFAYRADLLYPQTLKQFVYDISIFNGGIEEGFYRILVFFQDDNETIVEFVITSDTALLE